MSHDGAGPWSRAGKAEHDQRLACPKRARVLDSRARVISLRDPKRVTREPFSRLSTTEEGVEGPTFCMRVPGAILYYHPVKYPPSYLLDSDRKGEIVGVGGVILALL